MIYFCLINVRISQRPILGFIHNWNLETNDNIWALSFFTFSVQGGSQKPQTHFLPA